MGRFCFIIIFFSLSLRVGFTQHSGKVYSVDQGLENPEAVYSLDLSNLGLDELSDEILLFVNLETLDLSGNSFKRLPKQIFELPALKTLYLRNNRQLEVIPLFDALSKIPGLVSIDLSECNLRIVDTQIRKLINLQSINLSGNGLTDLPDEFGYLDNLKKVDLSDNALRSARNLPPLLNVLDLSFNPDLINSGTLVKLATMPFLDSLSLRGALDIPVEIVLLSQIKFLDLSDGLFKLLPDKLTGLSELKSLRFHNCTRLNLSITVRQLATLKKLQELSILDNNRQQLPTGLPALRKMKKITVSGARFSSLPFDFYKCRKLEEIVFTKTINIEPELVIQQVGLMKKVDKLAFVNSALTTLPVNLHFLKRLEELDLRGNLLDPGIKDLLNTVLPETLVQFDTFPEGEGSWVVDHVLMNSPVQSFDFYPEDHSVVELNSGAKINIPANIYPAGNAPLSSRKLTMEITEVFDPVSAFFNGYRASQNHGNGPSIRQIAAAFKIELRSPGQSDLTPFFSPVTVEWPSNEGHLHLDVFKEVPSESWTVTGRDELMLNEMDKGGPVNFEIGDIPDIPETPVAPSEPVTQKLSIRFLSRKKDLIFEIYAFNDIEPEGADPEDIKTFVELETIQSISWKYDGANPESDLKRLESVELRQSGFALDFAIIPAPESDNYRLYFESPEGNFDIPVYPLFNNQDYTYSDPEKDQELNFEFYSNYYNGYRQRMREWNLIEAEYQQKLQAHQIAVEDFRKGMEGLASLVSPSLSNDSQNTGLYRRKVEITSPGNYWIGADRQVIGEVFQLAFIDEFDNPLYPEKTFILDQTNKLMMEFPGSEVQFDPKADNTIIVYLPGGSIGYSLKSKLRGMPAIQKSTRQVIELQVLNADAIHPERIKNVFFDD